MAKTALICGLTVLFGVHALSAQETHRPPNIVFILADDLGYTDLGCYGSKFYETPHIDHLARQGARFTDGYSCGPNCQPTRAALMSGQYGPRTGIYTVGNIDRFNWQSRSLRPVVNVTSLSLEKVTIADSLKSAGYHTGLFGKWHLGSDAKHHPARRGFDEAIVSMGRHFDFATNPKVEYLEGTYLADFLTDKAIDFIRRNKEQPFFLYLPHFAVHSPFQAKQELVDDFRKKDAVGGHNNPTYAAMIRSVDESVGRVVAVLDELKLSNNTLVIFSSDNGGVGGYQREGIQAKDITDNSPLRGGKGMLYEGGVRVPWIFRWTGKIEAGNDVHVPINSVDLYPTLLAVAGAKSPENYILDGTNYFPLLTDHERSERRPDLFWHFPGYLGSKGGTWRTTPVGVIRSGDWKLIESFEDNKVELYNLRDDIGEKTNVADKHADKVAELRGKLEQWRQHINAPRPTANK